MEQAHFYTELAVAYVRGARADLVVAGDAAATIARARSAGLRLHRFKRTTTLARVSKVLGLVRGFAPTRLLDVGSGRGAFLWPLVAEVGGVAITAIDVIAHRVAAVAAVARGGVDGLDALQMDATALGFTTGSFDLVTVLEVLEHLERPALAAAEALRVARRAVVATVPAKADDNPGHIQLFDRDSLAALFTAAGARRVEVDHVLNHMVVVAQP